MACSSTCTIMHSSLEILGFTLYNNRLQLQENSQLKSTSNQIIDARTHAHVHMQACTCSHTESRTHTDTHISHMHTRTHWFNSFSFISCPRCHMAMLVSPVPISPVAPGVRGRRERESGREGGERGGRYCTCK